MRPADSTLEAPLAGVDDAAAAPPVVRDPVPAALPASRNRTRRGEGELQLSLVLIRSQVMMVLTS